MLNKAKDLKAVSHISEGGHKECLSNTRILLSSEYDEIAWKGFRSKHYCKAVPLARLLERSKYRRGKCQAQAQCKLLPIFKAEARGQIESRDETGTGTGSFVPTHTSDH